MSHPTNFRGANAVLTAAPEDKARGVIDLPIMRDTVRGLIVSRWTLSEQEIRSILRTGAVWLMVAGKTHPPVRLEGMDPRVPPDALPDPIGLWATRPIAGMTREELEYSLVSAIGLIERILT